MTKETKSPQQPRPRVWKEEAFGNLPDGQQITQYSCVNPSGTTLRLIDYGAIVVALEVVDREGETANVTLGFDQLEGYLQRHPYFGATVGRYGNRIARGSFTLQGKQYTLARNNGENHLHGGERGFDRVLWQTEKFENAEHLGATFSYESPAGEEGYPGNLRVTARYLLGDNDELRIEFTATTDEPTPINLTNHCYWNLGGEGASTILDHRVQIDADQYVKVDDGLIPTGELATVQQTPLDFNQPQEIGDRIEQLNTEPPGYDHCFVVRGAAGTLRPAASVHHPSCGRVMTVRTTQPGLQLYTGNFLDGSEASGGYPRHAGLCLETQHYPDSPNQPNFPSTILQPGEVYRQVTVYRFSVA